MRLIKDCIRFRFDWNGRSSCTGYLRQVFEYLSVNEPNNSMRNTGNLNDRPMEADSETTATVQEQLVFKWQSPERLWNRQLYCQLTWHAGVKTLVMERSNESALTVRGPLFKVRVDRRTRFVEKDTSRRSFRMLLSSASDISVDVHKTSVHCAHGQRAGP